MIVWRGRGFVVAIITFGCLVVAELSTRYLFHDDRYYQRQGWPKLVAFLVAAGLVWRLSRREHGDYATVQPAGRDPLLRVQDTLFHISVKYWPGILCVLAIVFFFVRV